MTIILSIAYLGYIFICKPEHWIIYLIQFFYVISSGVNINWYFFGVEKFKLTVGRNTIIKILTCIAIFMFVKETDDLWIYTLIISLGTFLSNAIIWMFLKKDVEYVKVNWSGIKRHIKPDIVLFLPVIAVSLYNIMDKLMLGMFSTYQEVGYYTYAEKIVQVPVTIIIALGTVMMPRVSNLMKNGKESECKILFDKAMLYVNFFSIAFSFGMANLAPVFSDWYYGTTFGRCGTFMVWLAPVIIFKSWANLVRTQFIIPKGYDNIYILSVMLGAAVNLIVNFLLIPRHEGMGAIVGTVVAEFVVCFIQTWKTRRYINFKPYILDSLVFGVIGYLMSLVMDFIKVMLSDTYKVIILFSCFLCGAVVYFVLSYVYLFCIRKDKTIITEVKLEILNKYRK